MYKKLLTLLLIVTPAMAYAEGTTITGTVQSKCQINTDVAGVYGNPTASKLSTARADGGVEPIIRYDVSLADAYIARIVTPTDFSTSPSLNDTLAWTGSVTVKEVSETAMADYEANKVTYDSTTDYNLHTAGTTWFQVSSAVEYGYGKAFPGGTYRSVVVAECIAK